jgi:hypothetical protein
MNKFATSGFLALVTLALPACSNETIVASNSGIPVQRTGYNSAYIPSASDQRSAQQAGAMGRSFDAQCLAKGPKESAAYNVCLQKLPASALLASNR